MTDHTPRGGAGWALLIVALALLIMLMQGCTVGPDYKRPEMDLPREYGVTQSTVPSSGKWWTLFNDPVLDRLEEEALAANYDLRAAAERIEQARAQLSIAHGDQLPSAGVEASRARARASQLGTFPMGCPAHRAE